MGGLLIQDSDDIKEKKKIGLRLQKISPNDQQTLDLNFAGKYVNM